MRATAAHLTEALEQQWPTTALYMTHGLAAFALVSELTPDEVSQRVVEANLELLAYEIWPLNECLVDTHQIVSWREAHQFPTLSMRLECDGLPLPSPWRSDSSTRILLS